MTVCFSVAPPPEFQVRGELIFEDVALSSEMPLEMERYRSEGERGKKGRVCLVPLPPQSGTPQFVALVGAGKREEFSDAVLREVTAEYVRYCTSQGLCRLSLGLSSEDRPEGFSFSASSAAAEGALAGTYRFDRYIGAERKSGAKTLESFALEGGDEAGLERGRIIGECDAYARDLCNEPGNVLNPATLAVRAVQLAARQGLDCTIIDDREMFGAGMHALWHAGKGSATPPCLVHLVYRPASARGRVAIIGKGVTFDSGGLCLKTREGIKTMKHDKSGACVMMGVMRAAALLKLPLEVHGLAGLVENMPDGGSYRPDDIIRAMNGKTIEVQNTDAEGRLTLADVLTFASKLEPDAIVDVATLTGAAVTALGKYTAALLCDDDDLSAALERASYAAGERLHRFAMDDERLREGIKGTFADLRQSSPDGGGTIAAGMFLREFVEPSIPWAHIDIAATGWYDREFGVYSKGASAYSLRTVVEYLSAL